ncbi:peptidase S10 [Botrimarina sp.]|uniref:S10 family peptidase n=1 Tax=Botrimarina sp. TaxID=2795802 RepID=UPI0032F05CCE
MPALSRPLLLLLALACLGLPAAADHHDRAASDSKAKASKQGDESGDGGKDKSDKNEDTDDEQPELSITTGSVTIDGEEVEYYATAGKLPQKDDSLDEKAQLFFVAYTKGKPPKDSDKHAEDGGPDASRPITFCFNGGPGSASLWLHLGMLGPKRVKLPDDASFPPPPYEVTDNPYSLLDVTDLVFIDPVSTGYSRAAEGEEKAQFHGLEEDIESVGRFIHDYTTRFGRWRSPKFLLGESYGGIRSGGLSHLLQDRYRMYLNGVVLVSAVLDFSTLDFAANNDLPYILFLPGYAVAAWEQKALDDELLGKSIEEINKLAEEFAYGDYADALLQGASMPEEKREEVAERFAELTGLSKGYVEDNRLRIPMWRFSKELLRDRNLMIGRYDSRYAMPGRQPGGDSMEYDPSGVSLTGIFSGAMHAYLREGLEYEDERVYEVFGSVRPWNYKPYVNSYVTTAEDLRRAMTENPALRVFAACGYHDLATPAFAMEHTRDHALDRQDLLDRFDIRHYFGGHMMYVYEPSLKELRKDLVKWYEEATP